MHKNIEKVQIYQVMIEDISINIMNSCKPGGEK